MCAPRLYYIIYIIVRKSLTLVYVQT